MYMLIQAYLLILSICIPSVACEDIPREESSKVSQIRLRNPEKAPSYVYAAIEIDRNNRKNSKDIFSPPLMGNISQEQSSKVSQVHLKNPEKAPSCVYASIATDRNYRKNSKDVFRTSTFPNATHDMPTMKWMHPTYKKLYTQTRSQSDIPIWNKKRIIIGNLRGSKSSYSYDDLRKKFLTDLEQQTAPLTPDLKNSLSANRTQKHKNRQNLNVKKNSENRKRKKRIKELEQERDKLISERRIRELEQERDKLISEKRTRELELKRAKLRREKNSRNLKKDGDKLA